MFVWVHLVYEALLNVQRMFRHCYCPVESLLQLDTILASLDRYHYSDSSFDQQHLFDPETET